jgi:hypothetical protein
MPTQTTKQNKNKNYAYPFHAANAATQLEACCVSALLRQASKAWPSPLLAPVRRKMGPWNARPLVAAGMLDEETHD